jgi:hypothetical protein
MTEYPTASPPSAQERLPLFCVERLKAVPLFNSKESYPPHPD